MSSVTLLVSSFDGLSECWGPFRHGLAKYWPDLPYPALLVTNEKTFEASPLRSLAVGEDRGWSENLRAALVRLESEYVIYFQEDYWLRERVDTARVAAYVRLMDENGLNYIRLLAFPAPDEPFPPDARLGVIATHAPYRTSLQVAVWRKSVLEALLDGPESAWQFEHAGTQRSRRYGPSFLSVRPRGRDEYFFGIRYLCSAINRGRWSRAARAYCREEGLHVDFSRLPSETWWDDFKRSGAVGRAVSLSEHALRRTLRDPFAPLRWLARGRRRWR